MSSILVLDGEVRISAEDTELSRLQNGDFFGEIALAAPEDAQQMQLQSAIHGWFIFYSRIWIRRLLQFRQLLLLQLPHQLSS